MINSRVGTIGRDGPVVGWARDGTFWRSMPVTSRRHWTTGGLLNEVSSSGTSWVSACCSRKSWTRRIESKFST